MPTISREELFWKKKEFISFVLSILVFFIHSYFVTDQIDGSLVSVINQKTAFFFCKSITQFAVPTFFMLSGVTFFKNYSNKKYGEKIKSRVFTLIIPYLLWNSIWMLYEILCSYSFLSNFTDNTAPFQITLLNVLKGIFFYGCNGPFWFIFDLIIYSLAAPVVFLLIRNKYIGIVSIVALSVLSFFGIQLPPAVFYSSTSIIFYMTGALMGYHYFDFILKKPKKSTQIFSLIFLIAYIVAKNAVPADLQYDNPLTEIITFTLCAFSFWNISDAFIEKIKPRAIYSRSFAIYAMHLGLSGIVWKILGICLPKKEWVLIPQFFLKVIITVIIINLICLFLEKFLPKVYNVLMGNRIRRKQ